MSSACCGPGSGAVPDVGSVPDSTERAGELESVPTGAGPSPASLIDIPATTFRMGDESPWAYPGDGEGPVHEVEVGAFRIDSVAVTNDAFARFAEATGWQTDAERFGWSFVFAGLLPDDFPPTRGVVGAEWWRQVFGADWRHPEGPQADLNGRGDHPVVHTSWFDAVAYCRWTRDPAPVRRPEMGVCSGARRAGPAPPSRGATTSNRTATTG